MFERIEGFGDNVIAVRGVGKVSASDYESVLVPAVERAKASGQKVRMLLELGPGFEGYDLGGMFADAKLGMDDFKSFEKLAVVTDNDLFRSAIHMFARFIPAAVQVFPVAEFDAAKAWVTG